MTDLSPVAQAVLDAAFTLADNLDRDVTETEIIAAALRAAADQLSRSKFIYTPNLLAIATELENTNV
jgi:hypothetical protein